MADKLDILGRQEFVDNLIDVVRTIADNHGGCTFAINGQWGCGKSFVLDMFQEQMSLFQHPDAAGDRYIMFCYNCWQYDYYEEPAIAIIAAIRNEIEANKQVLPEMPKEIETVLEYAKDLGKELVGKMFEQKLGVNPFTYLEKYQAKRGDIEKKEAEVHSYDSYFNFKSALDNAKKQLAKMASEKPIVIVVDELDRCIPEYAIKVMERLHHLFDGESNIIVVLAVDEEQLENAVYNIYGQKCDVKKYLTKFISFTMQLEKGELDDSYWSKYSEYFGCFDEPTENEKQELDELINVLFKEIDIRTQEKIMERLLILHNLSLQSLRHISILYFELIHGVLLYKCKCKFKKVKIWLTNPNRNTSSGLNEDYGEIYKFIMNKEGAINSESHLITRMSMGNHKEIACIKDTMISLTFWYFSNLLNLNNKDYCGDYMLEKSERYFPHVQGAKMFDKLSELIVP